jgi:2-keto-4-pentenoate hydratase
MLDERIRRGMDVQLAARRRRIDVGERPLGWKVGFGAQSAMNALGINRPLVGYLMHSGIIQSGAELPYSDFTRPAIEPEIAVYLGAELNDGRDKKAIEAAISGLGPAIEIADVSFPPTAGPEKILSGNVYQKGVVLGAVDERRAAARLNGLTATVRCDGTDVEIPDDLESNTGPILDVVAVVADTLAEMGERLHAGELIIVGSIVPPFILDDAAIITFALGDAEPISIHVI